MMKRILSTKEIEKKYSIYRTLFAVVSAIILAFILICFVSKNPLFAINQFVMGPLKSVRNFGNVLELMIPLIFAGLSVCIMFQADQINMSAEGAFFLGGLASTFIAVNRSFSGIIHPVLAVLLGGMVGMIVCSIPAVLKIKWNADVIVSSLMLNYIVLYLGNYLLQYYLLDAKAGYPASNRLLKSAKLSVIIPGTRVHTGLIVAIIATVIVYLLVYKTKNGYEIRMVGKNLKFAKYVGISVTGVMLFSQAVGGLIAGVGGSIEVLGMYKRYSWVALPGYCFDGIIIAILSKNNPKFVPLAAFFLAYLRIGADIMSRKTDVAPEVVAIVQALIILLIAAKLLLNKYKQREIVQSAEEKWRYNQ